MYSYSEFDEAFVREGGEQFRVHQVGAPPLGA